MTVLQWEEVVGLVIFSDHIYLSTGLLDALPEDDALAFVIAHEVTHIDLGHNQLKLRAGIPSLPPVLPLRLSLSLLARAWMRPELEKDADLGGLALAQAAGYRPEAFHAVFDVFTEVALEKNMAEHVSRDLSDWEEFWQQKATGYPSIEERRARLSAACSAAHPRPARGA